MNKIKIVNDKIEVDSNLEYSYEKKETNFLVNCLKLKITEDTDLELNIEISDSNKIDIFINVLEDVHLNIIEYISGGKLKIQYKYYLDKNSSVDIKKINNINSIKEYDIFNLNGENSSVKRVLKTISNNDEKYDMLVYHNAFKTNSNLINNGVNVESGTLTFNVSSFVPKDIEECVVNQNNRIINLTDNNCTISPNMYIDCYNVVANHSAFIGGFKSDELFYLQSRGINKIDATKLLIRGFLTNDLTEEQKNNYNKILDQYWR